MPNPATPPLATVRFRCTRRVEFRDTDAAGIVHFSAFFPMMEAAEHEFLRSLGLTVMQIQEDGSHLTWPRVAAACDYHAAAHFEDLLQIGVAVEHLGSKSIRYRFEFLRELDKIATGTLTAVCCQLGVQGLSSVEIPAEVRSKLDPRQP